MPQGYNPSKEYNPSTRLMPLGHKVKVYGIMFFEILGFFKIPKYVLKSYILAFKKRNTSGLTGSILKLL
jgi:hypothetical protein